MNHNWCFSCSPFAECIVPCIAGVIGGTIQVIRSKNYSFIGFIGGLLSSFFAALLFCWASKDIDFFTGKNYTVDTIAGLLGVSSHWVFDVALPRLRKSILDRADREVK